MDANLDRKIINNSYYDDLAQRWYAADDDPIALLRVETKEKLVWALPILNADKVKTVLDVGCGGGFVSNFLAKNGFEVSGLDFSEPSLQVARKMDETKSVNYVQGDAYKLPFEDGKFDAVIAFDFLEHVSMPEEIVHEMARVLKPGGRLLFHTFNRNYLSWLVAIKGVQWFVKNTPKNLHKLKLFIRPKELEFYCEKAGLRVNGWTGIRPKINSAFFKLLTTRRVPKNFEFVMTSSKLISYCGHARKESSLLA